MPNKNPLELPPSVSAATAWLFPGQGAQETGMGRDLYENSVAARAVMDAADRVLGYSLTSVCFEGPDEKLRDTRITQPAIMAVSLAAVAATIEAGAVTARPAFLAGHSLGEYSALVVAGALSLEDGFRLIAERARLMAAAGERQPGTLAAIIGLEEAAVEDIAREAGVDLCNLNLPSQTVIGGERERVVLAMALAKERGAQRALELNVSGAFHSRLMHSAVAGLETAVAAATVRDPSIPVVSNVLARPLCTAAEVRQELPRQVVSPVRWHQSVATMSAAGVTLFAEFGPGKVLTGLVKRLVPGATLFNVSSMAEAARASL